MKREKQTGARAIQEPASIARPSAWLGASLVLISFALFASALGNAYVFDGVALVEQNPLLANFEPLRIAGMDWWEGTGKPGGLYRPVSLLALAALRALGGGGPECINFTNVALHGFVAWLHFELLVRLLGARRGAIPAAWIAAFIALVHPLNAEVVGGQVGIADLLASLFMFAAVLFAQGRSKGRFALGVLLAAFAVLSKESGVLVVPLAILFEALRPRVDPQLMSRVLRALGWSCLGVAIAVACRYAAIGSLASADDPVYAGFSALARVASACGTFAAYSLPLLFAPWRQLAVVSHQDAVIAGGFADPRALAGALVIIALSVAPVFALRRGRRELAFGVWFFLLAALPTSNLFFSSGAIAASRFFYAGLIGLCLPLALLIVEAWSGSTLARAAAGLIAVYSCAVLPIVAWRECSVWHSERTLLEAQVARAPSSAYGLVDLAGTLRGEAPARAEELLERALQTSLPLIPGQEFPPEDLLETHFLARSALAEIREGRGERERCEREYRAAEQLAERGRQARLVLPFREDWTAHRVFALQHLGVSMLERAKNLDGAARASLLELVQRDLDACDVCAPQNSESVRLRSILLQLRGDPEGRARLVEEAWKARPEDALLRFLWANELRQRGRVAEALDIELDVAMKSFDNFDPARSLGIAKQGLGAGDQALVQRSRALLERLVRLDPRRAAAPSIPQEAAQLLRKNSPR